ncbi:MAG TPA: type II toxin-antitoxin system VapC family toxin [Ktedonobacteraceae bacterium]|nr:type II toxin-antitoxin system VapC family toxin [Ktedonobacteraceae bacterium]
MKEEKLVVVDTSLALKWLVYEVDSPLAQTLLAKWAVQSFVILAPYLLVYEITNSLYKKVRRAEIASSTAVNALNNLVSTGLTFDDTSDEKLCVKALDFAQQFKLPATYDAHYLALAEREQCEFWTADERLYNSVKEHLSWVRLMSDLASVSVAD